MNNNNFMSKKIGIEKKNKKTNFIIAWFCL